MYFRSDMSRRTLIEYFLRHHLCHIYETYKSPLYKFIISCHIKIESVCFRISEEKSCKTHVFIIIDDLIAQENIFLFNACNLVNFINVASFLFLLHTITEKCFSSFFYNQ